MVSRDSGVGKHGVGDFEAKLDPALELADIPSLSTCGEVLVMDSSQSSALEGREDPLLSLPSLKLKLILEPAEVDI